MPPKAARRTVQTKSGGGGRGTRTPRAFWAVPVFETGSLASSVIPPSNKIITVQESNVKASPKQLKALEILVRPVGLVLDDLFESAELESLARFMKMYHDSATIWVAKKPGCIFLANEMKSIFEECTHELTQGQGAQFAIVDGHCGLDSYGE